MKNKKKDKKLKEKIKRDISPIKGIKQLKVKLQK